MVATVAILGGLVRLFWEFEGDGEGVPAADGLAVHFGGDPFGHGFDHADGLGIEVGVYGANHFGFANGAVFFHHELDGYAALNVVLGSHFRIADV